MKKLFFNKIKGWFFCGVLSGIMGMSSLSFAEMPVTQPRIKPGFVEPKEGSAYYYLKDKALAIHEKRTVDGSAYMISGGIALGLSIPAYYASRDVFARSVYSLGQTLGIAAIGYGSYLKLIDDDTTRFYQLISVTDLKPEQRESLSFHYLKETASMAKRARRIRVITHGLTAALNFLNGATSDNSNLKTALYFLGGINSLAAISFSMSLSEEEKAFQQISLQRQPSQQAPSLYQRIYKRGKKIETKLQVGQTVSLQFLF